MKKVFQYLKPYMFRMVVGFAIKFLGTIMDLLLPWILAYMIDDIIPLKDMGKIIYWGFVMLVCSFFAIAGNILANVMASRVARNTTVKIRYDLFVKITHLSSFQVDTYSVPTLISRMTTDTYNVHQMLGMMQRIGVRAPILLIGGIMVTFTLDPVLTLVLIATLPFIIGVVTFVSKKGIPLYALLQIKMDEMVRKVRELVSGIRVVKALSKTEYEKEKFGEINLSIVQTERKAGNTMAVINPTMNLFLNIGLVFVILVGAYRVNSGLTAVGKIVAFLTYFTIILNAMLTITRIFTVYSKAIASANRIREILDCEEALTVEKSLEIFPGHTGNEYHVEFNRISFSYNKNENNISEISFQLKQGESLGIIGSTGSGKSTIIQLLMRLYDVDSGQILINGRDVKFIEKDELSQMFGVTFQNDVLFKDTIMENIRLGRDLTDEQVRRAAELALANEFIEEKADGYQADLSIKGANLSGGQKQRILIARALAGNPEILILDDSSSALDYRTDMLLRRAIETYMKKTTKIIIAQRVSSVMSLDHILVLEDGEMIGYGTHDELMTNCELYQEISRMQMGGEAHEA